MWLQVPFTTVHSGETPSSHQETTNTLPFRWPWSLVGRTSHAISCVWMLSERELGQTSLTLKKNTYIELYRYDINIIWYFHEQYSFPVCVFLGFGVIFDWRDFPCTRSPCVQRKSSRFGCGDSPRHLRDADSLRKWVEGSHLRKRIFQQELPPFRSRGGVSKTRLRTTNQEIASEKIVTFVGNSTGFFQDWMSWDTP